MRYQSYSKRIDIVQSCVYSLIDAADADGDAPFAWQLTPGNTLSDTDNGEPVPARSVQTIAISTVSIVKWIILVCGPYRLPELVISALRTECIIVYMYEAVTENI